MSEEAGAVVRLGRFLRNDWRTFTRRFDRVRRWFSARYMHADPRTLGLTRWLIGALLCAECLRRGSYARDYYSNDGLLSNHWHLFSPDSEFNFSLFHAFSTPAEVYVAFALAFSCFFLFMVGYRTRLFNVLSLIWITSMDNRLVMIENGGYVVVNLITFWLCWVPSGARFSIDSLRRARREDRATTADALNEPFAPRWLTERHHSLASMILLLNFGIIYVFNVVNKYGGTWRSGETVHYVLHLDRMVTGMAVPFREMMPLWGVRATTWTVLVVEAMIVMTIFWPYHRRWARPVALVLIFGLHASFGLMMRLGPFSWFMIGWSSVLLMAVHWEAIEAWYARRQPAIEVSFD
ncbi:MAG: HTTM domain-containing protein, partial [Polyangiaceae bacterium]